MNQILSGQWRFRRNRRDRKLANDLDTNACGIYTCDSWAVSKSTSKHSSPQGHRGNSVVTKKEIVRTISEEIGLTQLKTKEIVQKTFDAIVETLVDDKRIELRNFGVFEVKKRAARKARNPRTGDKVDVPEKYVVTFKPGKEMEEKVRQLEEREAAARLGSVSPAPTSPSPLGEPEPSSVPPPSTAETLGTPRGYETNPGSTN